MMTALLVLLLLVGALVAGFVGWRRQAALAGPGRESPAPRRISLVTEAVGYIGTILVLAGAFAYAQQRWEDLSEGTRFATLVVATGVFLGLGGLVRTSAEPALRRLASVTWAVSVSAFAGSIGMANVLLDAHGKTVFVTVATSTAVYALVLWLLNSHGVQQVVAFGTSCVAVASIVTFAVTDASAWMIAVPLWAMGAGWAAIGWRHKVQPWFVTLPAGLLVALVAPATIEHPSGLRFGLGIATATAVMVAAVLTRLTPALAMGAVAELGYVIGAVAFYFGSTLGVPASLAITGLLILAAAVAAARWRAAGPRPPAPPGDDAPVGPRHLTGV